MLWRYGPRTLMGWFRCSKIFRFLLLMLARLSIFAPTDQYAFLFIIWVSRNFSRIKVSSWYLVSLESVQSYVLIPFLDTACMGNRGMCHQHNGSTCSTKIAVVSLKGTKQKKGMYLWTTSVCIRLGSTIGWGLVTQRIASMITRLLVMISRWKVSWTRIRN